MPKYVTGLIMVLMTALLGCASIMNGPTQDIGISSNPSGATVLLDGSPLGKTPIVAHLSRKDNHVVKINLEGYQTFEAMFTRSASGWVWGNLVFSGLIGLAVDAITGSMYKLTPDQMQAELRKGDEAMGVIDKTGSLYLTVVLHPQPGWQKIGNL